MKIKIFVLSFVVFLLAACAPGTYNLDVTTRTVTQPAPRPSPHRVATYPDWPYCLNYYTREFMVVHNAYQVFVSDNGVRWCVP
jgi:hypothetical protein